MSLVQSARAIAQASGDQSVDWVAVERAATAAVSPGTLDRSTATQTAYAADVRAAREEIRDVTGLSFTVPATIELQDRHHWIERNVDTFSRVLAPLEDADIQVGGLARRVNTGSMALSLGILARAVLGQYDPLLLADRPDEHGLYVVEPNVRRAADVLGVERDRFRRWIIFHEVAHAAEFGAAPWLAAHLETRLHRSIGALEEGSLDPEAFTELNLAMTAVEGYAELVMDRAFDRDPADLRDRLDSYRRRRGLGTRFLRRIFGLGLKRRQYERGRAFFEAIERRRGLTGAGRVWDGPEFLPTEAELEDPDRWLARTR